MRLLLMSLTAFAISLLCSNSSYAQDQDNYVVLSEEKFKEIEEKMYLQEDWIPILIEGYSKSELVAFYIQSYSEKTISTWVEFAYNKMKKFESIKPTEAQDLQFKKIIALPRNAQNMYQFMMIMTEEQIESVGY